MSQDFGVEEPGLLFDEQGMHYCVNAIQMGHNSITSRSHFFRNCENRKLFADLRSFVGFRWELFLSRPRCLLFFSAGEATLEGQALLRRQLGHKPDLDRDLLLVRRLQELRLGDVVQHLLVHVGHQRGEDLVRVR